MKKILLVFGLLAGLTSSSFVYGYRLYSNDGLKTKFINLSSGVREVEFHLNVSRNNDKFSTAKFLAYNNKNNVLGGSVHNGLQDISRTDSPIRKTFEGTVRGYSEDIRKVYLEVTGETWKAVNSAGVKYTDYVDASVSLSW